MTEAELSNSVIVIESPNKADKYRKYTGATVIATVGHFKDIPKASFGINLKTYYPTFRILPGRSAVMERLKKSKGKIVIIATDPDREGYAIGDHVYTEIKSYAKSVYRAEVREITEKGIKEAIASAVPFEKTNQGQYKAFLGRRVGDRLIGYMLSPAISNKMKQVYSVGRVQSPGLRMVVDREKEIKSFKKEPFYQIRLTADKNGELFNAFHESGNIKSREAADIIVTKLKAPAAKGEVLSIAREELEKPPKGPFTTSTLQQAAYNRLKFDTDKTMAVAQSLFEKGLITYHRTDSQRISIDFIQELRTQIINDYGKKYCPEQPLIYSSKNSQAEAHEGIRPTEIIGACEQGEYIKKHGLDNEQEGLFRLICNRTIASQMAKAVTERMIVMIDYGDERFKAVGNRQLFDGWTRQYEDKGSDKDEDNSKLPKLEQGEKVVINKLDLLGKETRPPKRYTEATLVKELETKGIGRPSTYAAIIKSMKTRRYVINEKGALLPTEAGERLIEILKKEYPWVIDYGFTKDMENYLDLVQAGQGDWQLFAKNIHEKTGFIEPPIWKIGNKTGGKANGKRASRN